MQSQNDFIKATGRELSIYEVNYHTTGGDGSLDHRRTFIASIGGGVNMANYMLLFLKNSGIRSQCLFNFNQRSFGHSADLKQMKGSVPLWGTSLLMKKAHERARPIWLAMEMINRVIGKDLVETVQTGARPTFVAEGLGIRKSRKPLPPEEFPVLYHYGFRDGTRRALLLVNLHVSAPHPVRVAFEGRAVGGIATATLLTSDKITDDNETDSGGDPPVKTAQSTIRPFQSGAAFELPPFSMLTLEWELEN